MATYAPIALFVYNRLDHTRSTIEALCKNLLAADTDLYIFSDAPKSAIHENAVKEVRAYIKTIKGFKKIQIIERLENLGLSASLISGVSEIINKDGKIIVLEDDLVTSPNFLNYMNDALDLYQEEDKVISIHGYMYPVQGALPETFFLKGADCWGWATWKRGWEIFEKDGKKLLEELKSRNLTYQFNFNNSYPYTNMLEDQIAGKVDSWAIRWYASAFLKDKLTLYPGKPLVQNIGMDGSGLHCAPDGRFLVELNNGLLDLKKIPLVHNKEVVERIAHFYNPKKFKKNRIKLLFKWMFGNKS